MFCSLISLAFQKKEAMHWMNTNKVQYILSNYQVCSQNVGKLSRRNATSNSNPRTWSMFIFFLDVQRKIYLYSFIDILVKCWLIAVNRSLYTGILRINHQVDPNHRIYCKYLDRGISVQNVWEKNFDKLIHLTHSFGILIVYIDEFLFGWLLRLC